MTRVVAIGGGHGLAATLRAARTYADDVTAIVAVADDGGSSGRLRETLDLPAPGDVRRCLSALAPDGSVLARTLEHRFAGGDLDGHAVGNILLAGLMAVTGDFVAAVDEVAAALGASGRVLPATTQPVTLKAGEIEGQVAIQNHGGVDRVTLAPADPPAPPAAVEAIGRADQVVIGPGSLYTSVLAAAIVPDVRRALAATSATRVYVCNLRPEVPETAGYDVASHVDALAAHGIAVDVVLTHAGALPLGDTLIRCVEADVATPGGAAHDPHRLGVALAALL